MEPSTIQYALDLAVQHHQAGRLHEAEKIYRQILAQQPGNAGVLLNLGVIAGQMGRNDVAVELIGRVIALNPNFAEAHFNLGVALKEPSQVERAIVAFQRAVALKPNYVQAHYFLGNARKDKGEFDQAIAAYQKAIALGPNHADAHNNLGIALKDKGRIDEAIAAFQRAIAIRADFAGAHYNLGIVLKDAGQLDGAIVAYHTSIALNPNKAEVHGNLGNALKEKGEFEAAVEAYRRATILDPNLVEAHYNFALVLLLHGEWEQGWPEYEWRWKLREFQLSQREFSQPIWDSSDLNGRTILLHAEQGFGDAIQFMRYVPLVAGRGGRVIVEVRPQLLRLMRGLAGVEEWISSGEPIPAFDVRCSLMSLPHRFGTTLQTIPGQEPLRVNLDLVQTWQRRLGSKSSGLKIGLAWAGSPTFKGDRTRSMSLDRLEPLSQVGGVTFYSIQKGAAAAQAEQPPSGLQLVNLSPDLQDFADTAAVMSAMDLVITTDTSVAHLAGALGRPVWVMLQFVPDWRWLLDRQDCPWYPTMRLFRQNSPGDWAGVIASVVRELGEYSA